MDCSVPYCKGLHIIVVHVCMYEYTYSKSIDQPGKVASPARGQLNRKNEYFPVRVVAYICMYFHTYLTTEWIKRVRLPILLVVS